MSFFVTKKESFPDLEQVWKIDNVWKSGGFVLFLFLFFFLVLFCFVLLLLLLLFLLFVCLFV